MNFGMSNLRKLGKRKEEAKDMEIWKSCCMINKKMESDDKPSIIKAKIYNT